MAMTFSLCWTYSHRASSITKALFTEGMAEKSRVSRLFTAGNRAARVRRSTMCWWRSLSSSSASRSRYRGWSTLLAAYWASIFPYSIFPYSLRKLGLLETAVQRSYRPKHGVRRAPGDTVFTAGCRSIPVRTFAHWNRPPPGFLEIDLVARCGESMGGSFVYSLVAREQSLVVAGLDVIANQLPFPVLGIDSDNDSVIISDTLTEYCAERGIEFTSKGLMDII